MCCLQLRIIDGMHQYSPFIGIYIEGVIHIPVQHKCVVPSMSLINAQLYVACVEYSTLEISEVAYLLYGMCLI